MKHFIRIFIICTLFIQKINSQDLTQTIRGLVLDKQSQQPLPGANILIEGSNPIIGSSSDIKGYFKLLNVPVGRTNVTISFVGYQTINMQNLALSSGKELFLTVELEEQVTHTDEVVVRASKSKTKANNEMATVSARSFTVEETEKYAGSRGDIARMAANFAGVSFANDSRNDIVIRGNSPSGLLWRLEDIDIPNPNHFAENGTTGGPVGMLNNNTLKNSDFFTGAFPAEYGNALSGVFDLKMRNGNNEKHEFTAQTGFNGFEFGAEGPVNRSNQSSYMVYYRYSTLEIFDKLGINLGAGGVPKYQDISFKVNYPIHNGVVTIFGLGGKSQIAILDSKQKGSNLYVNDGNDLYDYSNMFTSGISYMRYTNTKTYIKFILSGLTQENGTTIDSISTLDKSLIRYLNHDMAENRASLTFQSGTKFSSKFNTKLGLTVDQMGFNLNDEIWKAAKNKFQVYLSSSKSLGNGTQLIRSYYEANYKLSDKLSINPGVQAIYFTLNNHYNFEPRIGLSWEYASNRKINIGYGLHSHIQTLATYFIKDSNNIETNKNLDFTKSHQFVLGHDWTISDHFRLKSELYYQYLYSIPVEKNPSYFSMINSGASFGFDVKNNMVNTGTGYNYGMELTFEKFLDKNYYFLITTSLFESKYKGSDGIERNTAFNGNYVANFLFGYDYPINQKWTIGGDIKVSVAGGKRKIPIDSALSQQMRQTEYIYSDAFNTKYPDFFKLDLRFIIKDNINNHISQEWQISAENATNHKNILLEAYSNSKDNGPGKPKGGISKVYQLGILPLVLWRLNF
jgi:hypothetical protein